MPRKTNTRKSIKRPDNDPCRICILGYGKEGKAMQRFLKRTESYATIEIRDQKFDPNYLKGLDAFDIIYRSPGVPYTTQELQQAKKKGVILSSSTKYFLEHAPGKIIGITGTKGKGTTSTLLYKILKKAGKDVFLAGNIGTPAISILEKLTPKSITILELSSFQLHDCERSPHIAVLLDIFPDHMDSHTSFAEYVKAKSSIAQFQSAKDHLFYNARNTEPKKIAQKSKATLHSTSPSDHGSFFNELCIHSKLPGTHNQKNVLVASLVAKHLRVSKKTIFETVKTYRGIPYRLQYITTIQGVAVYNDSASTNPMTTIAAIQAIERPTILMAGGKDKNLDYTPLSKAISSSHVTNVFLFGENREKIANAIGEKTSVRKCVTVKTAFRNALTKAKKGSVIVLSPGAASFDQFSSYIARGAYFSKIAKEMKNKYTS
jgi:UDP-N-acetylmuramoylalanine--D-glutamate ligase